MLKILSLLLILPATVFGLSANHISPHLRAGMARVQTLSVMNDTEVYRPVIMRLTSEQSVGQLESMGVTVWYSRDDLAIGTMPVELIPEVIGSRWISDISSSQASLPSMNKAAPWVGLDKIRDRVDLDRNYDGEGVVVGFHDIGFDPSHISFLNSDGSPRTMRLTHYDGVTGERKACTTPSEIENWTTDNVGKYHATHVCGILAGFAPESPYNGVAQKSEIVATTSNLHDPEILAGIEDVVAYARQEGKPAVVNLSLSSAMGPHDGTQLFNEYIDKLGQEAIITVSSGNYATVPVCVSKRLTPDDTRMGTAFMDEWVWCGFNVSGACDFWSDNDEELEADLLIIDDIKREITARIKAEGEETIIISHEYAEMYPMGTVHPDFDNLFSGVVILYRELNPLNNRYNVYVEMAYSPRLQETPKGWSQTWIGVEMEGNPGTKIDGYASPGIHLSQKAPSLLAGNGVGSVSDIATARNVVSVGAYSTCNSVTQLNGEAFDFTQYKEGEIAYFSSYATLVDGRKVPLVSAPGAVIVSAVSTPFLENGGGFRPLVDKQNINGKTYYWGAEAGTSMSSPLVAGGIALWLQADPSLDIDDVKRIISETSPLPEGATEPGWGCGSLDMYAGLKMIRQESGVDNVVEPLKPNVVRNGDLLTVTSVETLPVTCTLTAVNGMRVNTVSSTGTVTIPLDGLPKGVYILNINQNGTDCGSMKIIR